MSPINSQAIANSESANLPIHSRTVETLLVRREGNDAVFLNELKFKKNTALNLRVSLEKKELPAVQVALGHEGIVEGRDYRGVPVIANVRPVPDSPWFLVARMDTSEVYAPVRERLWGIAILVCVLLFGSGAGVGLVWRRQRVQFYRERSEKAEALAIQKRIADIFLTIPDEEMFYEVLKVILNVMQSPFGVFGYLDENGDFVVPTMTRHIWDKCQIPEKTFIFPRDTWGDSSWPRAIREKKLNYTNETSTKTPEGHINIQRHISMPILFQGEVIGLFQVANKETDYTEADIRLLESIAMQIVSILNARLQRDRKEKERKRAEEALSEIKTLRGIIPICSSCKKIRDDKGYWHQVEVYISDHSEADFSHGICEECARKLYPEAYKEARLGKTGKQNEKQGHRGSPADTFARQLE